MKSKTLSKKEVWDILKTPPKTPGEIFSDELSAVMAKMIQEEIDKEILAKIIKEEQRHVR